jgi:hypothetical protein
MGGDVAAPQVGGDPVVVPPERQHRRAEREADAEEQVTADAANHGTVGLPQGHGRPQLSCTPGAHLPRPFPGRPRERSPAVGYSHMDLPIRLDLNGLTAAVVGDQGVDEADLDAIAGPAAVAVDAILGRRGTGEIGFFDLPDDRATAQACLDYARDLPPEIDTMVVLGIGGSSLGPKALYSALGRPLDPLRSRTPGAPRRLLFPDNADPATLGRSSRSATRPGRCGTWSRSPAGPPRPRPSS